MKLTNEQVLEALKEAGLRLDPNSEVLMGHYRALGEAFIRQHFQRRAEFAREERQEDV